MFNVLQTACTVHLNLPVLNALQTILYLTALVFMDAHQEHTLLIIIMDFNVEHAHKAA